MNAPSSLAWMLSEILHGCPAFAETVMVHFCSISSHRLFGHAATFRFLGVRHQ